MAGPRFACVYHVENFRSFAISGICERNLRTAREKRTDRKAQRFDSLRGDTLLAQHAGRGLIGNNENVAGRVKPRSTNRNRVGDYGDESKGTLTVPEQLGDEMAVNRIGGYNDVRVALAQKFSKCVAHFAHRANLRHEKSRTIKDRKDARPKCWCESHDVLVSFLHHRVEPRGAKFE